MPDRTGSAAIATLDPSPAGSSPVADTLSPSGWPVSDTAVSGTAVSGAAADDWPTDDRSADDWSTDDWPTNDGPADDGPGLVVSFTRRDPRSGAVRRAPLSTAPGGPGSPRLGRGGSLRKAE